MAIKCPACGAENPDDAKACAFCPESFPDEEEELRKPKFKTIDPGTWSIKRWLFIFALIGLFVWRGFAQMMLFLEKAAEPMAGRAVGMRTSVDQIIKNENSHDAMHSAMQVMIGTAPSSALTSAQELRKGTENSGNSPFGRRLDGPPAAGAKPEDEGPRWHFKGTVFNIVTLKAVPGVWLTFKRGAKKYEDTTNDSGAYDVNLPALDDNGYDVVIKHADYAKTYLNPAAEKVAEMPEDDRRDMAHDLNHADEGPYQVQAAGEYPVTTDFYIAPKSASGSR